MKHRYIILHAVFSSDDTPLGATVRLVRETSSGDAAEQHTICDVSLHRWATDSIVVEQLETVVNAMIALASQFEPDKPIPDWFNLMEGDGAQSDWIIDD